MISWWLTAVSIAIAIAAIANIALCVLISLMIFRSHSKLSSYAKKMKEAGIETKGFLWLVCRHPRIAAVIVSAVPIVIISTWVHLELIQQSGALVIIGAWAAASLLMSIFLMPHGSHGGGGGGGGGDDHPDPDDGPGGGGRSLNFDEFDSLRSTWENRPKSHFLIEE